MRVSASLSRRAALRWACGVLLLACTATAPVAHAQDTDVPPCEALVAEAQDRYLNGAYEAAIQRAAQCFDRSDVEAEDAVQAYRLISLAHLKLDELDAAREAIVNLLGVAPTYEPDPVQDPPTYVSMVAIVKQEVQPAGTSSDAEEERPGFFRRTSTWVVLSTTLVAGGVTAFLTLGGESITGGGGGPTTLPPPPGTP